MANTGNTQQQINYGAAVNDGNGDPLRTAFIKTDDNFDNVWLAGPVGSNITITNNIVQVNNTNGNLILSPNGVGVIQTNSRLLPRLNNTYDFGSTTLKYRTGYFGSGGLVVDGNVTVAGNLTAGNISYTGNVFVGDLQGSVYADDSTVMVDAIDNLLFASGATISGNVSADYFVGNGALLTGIVTSSYSNANVVSLLSAFGSNTILTTGNISGAFVAPGGNGQVMYNRSGLIGASPYDFNFDESTFTLYVKSASFSGETDGTDALYVGAPGYTFLGSDIMAQFTGNVDSYSQINFQNINPGTLASGDYILTADNGTDSTYYLDIGLASSNHADSDFFGDTSTKNDAYIYVVADDQAGPSIAGGPGNLILGSTNGAIKMFVGNTAQASVVATVESGQLLMSGNIVPVTSNTYSLGNATNQWSDLYVSNATIYMNNIPISLTAGNVLTVNGADVVTTSNIGAANIGNLFIQGTNISIVPGTPNTGIELSPNGEGWAYLQLPTNDTANASNTRLHNDAGNIEFGTGDFSTGVTSYTWTLDNTGNLNLPTNGDLNFDAGGIVQAVDEDFVIRVQDADDDGFAVIQQVDDGDGNVLGQTELRRDRFIIGFADGAAPQFRFVDTGEMEIAGNVRALEYEDTSLYSVSDNDGNGSIELKVISFAGDVLGSNVRVTQSNATISTSNALYTWNFDYLGNLTLPLNGNLVGSTPNNNGYINWFGNSSGDNNGYTTMRLVPDDTRESGDQYLIIDPTLPGHIHIRAGGTQDNSGADLFLGGENSYFKVRSGANANVEIGSNSYVWTFGTDSVLTVPNEGVIQSLNDTVILQSKDTGSGNIYSVRVGTNGGLYFEATGYNNGWFNITNDSGNADMVAPAGNINITPAFGVANGAGKSLNLHGGDADQSDFYTGTGGAVNITGGLGGFNDGGGGGPGGSVNITSGNSSDPAGHAGNVKISSGANNWVFDYTGNLTIPSTSGGLIKTVANASIGIVAIDGGTDNPAQLMSWPVGQANPNTIVSTYTNNASIQTDVNGTMKTWAFDSAGNLPLPTGGYVVVSGGLVASGASPAPTISGFSTIGASGNITGGNLITAGNVVGNVNGYSIGYRDIPQISFSGNTTIATTDAGKHYYSTLSTGNVLTIANNASQGFQVGAAITVVNQGTGAITIAQGSGVTLYLAGNATSGNRTLSTFGMATIMKVATDTWFINGTGVS